MDKLIDRVLDKYIAFDDNDNEGYCGFVPSSDEHGGIVSVELVQVFNCMSVIAPIPTAQGNNLIID